MLEQHSNYTEHDVHRQWIGVEGVPTYILTQGIVSTSEPLILIIPGNPGVSEYYAEFMDYLHKMSHLAVCCISHAGHVTHEQPLRNYLTAGRDWLTLDGQIQHKLAFIRNHLPVDMKLFLVGHSIGCYMILKMLSSETENSLSAVKHCHVLKCCLLFPTIERMSQSPNGRLFTPLLRYCRWLLPFLLYPVCYLLPTALKLYLIQRHLSGDKVAQCAINATLKLLSPTAITNCAYLANTEMDVVQHADLKTISSHIDVLFFYYGRNDAWCPTNYYYEIKELFPTADIELCTHNVKHAFVLSDSKLMAEIVCSRLV